MRLKKVNSWTNTLNGSFTSSSIFLIGHQGWCFADWASVFIKQPLFYAVCMITVTTVQSSYPFTVLVFYLKNKRCFLMIRMDIYIAQLEELKLTKAVPI